jgi:hypothetical protein
MDYNIEEIVEQLRDDNNYYGELGRRFLSASDIKTLHNNPLDYGAVAEEDKSYFLKGDYFHKRVLQPELVKSIPVVDASTRGTKIYKEFVEEHTLEGMPKPMFLLKKEVDELEALAWKIEQNEEFTFALQADVQPNEIEEPMVGQIFGYWFKGKADRINRHRGFIADIKTTRSLSSFVSQFEKMGYHAQAYIYQKLFGLPMRFYVVSKEDGKLGVYDVSKETLERAEDYIKWALEKMEMYYGENPTEDIGQYYEYQLL